MVSSNKQAKAPISSHPAFPAIVALWFAALLGIGSLIVPAAVFEWFVAVCGLTEILPAAQPPLGMTARLIIAIAGSLIGGAIGLMLARKASAIPAAMPVATPVSAATKQTRKAHPPREKRPISALEELGSPSLDQPVEADDTRTPAASEPAVQIDEWEAEDGLSAEQEPSPVCDTMNHGATDVAELTAANPQSGLTAEHLISRPLDELGIVQLVERFALSLQQRPAPGRPELQPGDWPSAAQIPPSVLPAVAPLALPDVLRPVEFACYPDDMPDDNDQFSSLLSLKKVPAGTRQSVKLPGGGDTGEAETAATFPSADGAGSTRKFGSSASPSAADALSSERTSTADTERTLRDALEQLQKMTGTG